MDYYPTIRKEWTQIVYIVNTEKLCIKCGAYFCLFDDVYIYIYKCIGNSWEDAPLRGMFTTRQQVWGGKMNFTFYFEVLLLFDFLICSFDFLL